MRLLHVVRLEFAEFNDQDKRPDYVVASHRWVSGEETTFKEVREKRNRGSIGYKKVKAFAEYVRKHVSQVEWLWIDTCCIDKDSAVELSEAINSMFRWYREATICIAYLADVEAVEERRSFEQSEWFQRGWTLQELLAPRAVVFMTSNWQVIGHKGSSFNSSDRTSSGPNIEADIARITKIPEEVLRDYVTSVSIGIDRKMQWMQGRSTTREEDMSYALFGICGVAPGANYGEGSDFARHRLQTAIRLRDDMTGQQVVSLHKAVHDDDLQAVRRLSRQGVDINTADNEGRTPLHIAASLGLERMLTFLLSSNAHANATDDHGQTPLHKAILNNHFALAKILDHRGGDVNVKDDNGNKPVDLAKTPFLARWCMQHGLDTESRAKISGSTALIQAACEGDVDAVIYLHGLGADVHAQNASGSTALTQACTRGHTAVVRKLLQHGADANATDDSNWSPFTRCIWAQQEEVLTLLLDHGGVLIDAPYTSNARTPLMEAIYGQQWSIMKILLQKGADPNKRGPEGDSPLRRACLLSGCTDAVKSLLDHKADVNAADPDGWTALGEAIHHRSWSVVELLLEHKASLDCLIWGGTVLTELLSAKQYPVEPQMLRRLVERGAPIDGTNLEGLTPLHLAVRQAHASSVSEILSLGGDPNKTLKSGHDEFRHHEHLTVLMHMVWQSREWHGVSFRSIIVNLLKHGARLEDKDSFGWTALRIAAEKGFDDVACFLILRGADIASTGHDGQTPLSVARRKHMPQFKGLIGDVQ